MSPDGRAPTAPFPTVPEIAMTRAAALTESVSVSLASRVRTVARRPVWLTAVRTDVASMEHVFAMKASLGTIARSRIVSTTVWDAAAALKASVFVPNPGLDSIALS